MTPPRTCAACQRPIHGDAREVVVDQGTSASPPLYVHPQPCKPRYVRRTT